MGNLAKNVHFITRKTYTPHLMSQFTFCRYVVLTSLGPPPKDPNTFFYNRGDIYLHYSVIYLGKDSDY